MNNSYIKLAQCALLFIGFHWTYKKTQNYIKSSKLKKITENKRKDRENEFSKLKEKYQMNPSFEKIIGLDVEDLIQKLQSRELSAVDVYSAFMAKALEINEKFNCVTEFNPNGLKIAQELDSLDKNYLKPLHGLPFCIKESHNVEGMITTFGYSSSLANPKAKENAVIVQILCDLGSIPFCKTNVPQTMFSYGSHNPIYGTTKNCLNPDLSPSGSSSGTACLVGANGAVFGTGSDIAGSLRLPSHCCGTTSIMPTQNRISGDNKSPNFLPSTFGLKGVSGVICKDVKFLAKLFKLITEDGIQHKYDPIMPPIKWDNELFSPQEKLRIGYYTSLDFLPSIGDTEKTILTAKSHFEEMGHTCVEFEMPDAFSYVKIGTDFIFAHFKLFSPFLKNEEISLSIRDIYYYTNLPNWQRNLFAWLAPIRFPFKNRSTRNGIMFTGGVDIENYKGLTDALVIRSKIVSEIYRKMEDQNIDLILCPTFPCAAYPVKDENRFLLGSAYTMIWNLADFPAGVVKVGIESGDNLRNYNDENDALLKGIKDSAMKSINMPISVQIVGKSYKEEQVLRAMLELEEFIQK